MRFLGLTDIAQDQQMDIYKPHIYKINKHSHFVSNSVWFHVNLNGNKYSEGNKGNFFSIIPESRNHWKSLETTCIYWDKIFRCKFILKNKQR